MKKIDRLIWQSIFIKFFFVLSNSYTTIIISESSQNWMRIEKHTIAETTPHEIPQTKKTHLNILYFNFGTHKTAWYIFWWLRETVRWLYSIDYILRGTHITHTRYGTGSTCDNSPAYSTLTLLIFVDVYFSVLLLLCVRTVRFVHSTRAILIQKWNMCIDWYWQLRNCQK